MIPDRVREAADRIIDGEPLGGTYAQDAETVAWYVSGLLDSQPTPTGGAAMNATHYQRRAERTFNREEGSDTANLALVALGIGGEGGEVIDLIKKHLFHGHPLDREKLQDELGDILWYIAIGCTVLDITLSDVMQSNIRKLEARYPEGFSQEASLKRKEQGES